MSHQNFRARIKIKRGMLTFPQPCVYRFGFSIILDISKKKLQTETSSNSHNSFLREKKILCYFCLKHRKNKLLLIKMQHISHWVVWELAIQIYNDVVLKLMWRRWTIWWDFFFVMKRTQPEIKRIFCEVNFTHYGVFLFWMCKSFVE